MSVAFKKTGVVNLSNTGQSGIIELVDESNNNLTDESGNWLISGSYTEEYNSYGFYEGANIMSVYESKITALEIIEW